MYPYSIHLHVIRTIKFWTIGALFHTRCQKLHQHSFLDYANRFVSEHIGTGARDLRKFTVHKSSNSRDRTKFGITCNVAGNQQFY